MIGSRRLRGRKVGVLATDGFEKVELTVPVAALRQVGADVEILSLRSGRIRGVNLHEPASRVRVDRLVQGASPSAYDALLLPGGFINPDLLRQSKEARAFVREFDRSGKPLAFICHAPWLLASAGLVADRVMTSWPGVRDDLVHAGATWVDEPVVRDGNWLSSRGPQDLVPFVSALIEHFSVEGSSLPESPAVEESSPPRDEPPQAMLTAMKWMPRPSLRTVVALGAVLALFSLSTRSPSQGTEPRRAAA